MGIPYSASNVETLREVVEDNGFVDGNNVSDTIARVHDHP